MKERFEELVVKWRIAEPLRGGHDEWGEGYNDGRKGCADELESMIAYNDEITAMALDYLASKDKIEKAVGPAFKELAESQECKHGCTKAHAYRDKEGLMDTCWGPKK